MIGHVEVDDLPEVLSVPPDDGLGLDDHECLHPGTEDTCLMPGSA